MNKLYIYDFIFSSILAGINIYFVKSKDYRILAGIIWSFFIACSLLINYNQLLYFTSLALIGICVSAIYVIKKIEFIPEYTIIFWLLFSISSFVIIGIIVSKKFVYNNVLSMPQTGDKGITGSIGTPGKSYILKTNPEKCYDILIDEVENYLVQNKINNEIDYDKYEFQLKNIYFKGLLKRICLSKEFGDYIFGTNKVDECKYDPNTTKRVGCDKTTQATHDEKEELIRYNRIVKALKNIVIRWTKEILKNNDYENKKLSEKLGFSTNIKETQWGEITSSDNFIEDYKYNSKVGHIFFNDHFYNDKYFDQHIIKKTNITPFKYIKNKEQFKIKIGDDDLGNPYYWGC